MAPALTGIPSNLTSPKPPIQSKSACHPPHHKGRRCKSGRAPGKSEDEGAAGEPKKDGD
ncbi:MAG: hypothetical protein IBX40_09765 [Methanosarcinales archaeon]|nr:hypothetical protein [Methanosarcinales archaeon]